METINLAELTSGYRERMRRLAILSPLEELSRKRQVDEEKKEVDMRGLGLLTLLFFFERRLSRVYQTGVQHLAEFLARMTREQYSFQEKELEKIAQDLIATFRPAKGKKRSFSFFNWETKQNESIEFSILKDNGFDQGTQRQYYTLDEDGLELLFATKEFYSEFQISINQLLLKQQIKKGEFHDALRQIREMELDVSVLQERMEKMRLEILRSIISEETYKRYEQLLEETYLRLEREDDEFKELSQFVKETRDTVFSDQLKRQNQPSYQLIINIVKELEAVHYDHARLLQLTSELRTTALATAQESLYYTGIQSFNFDQDIVSTILGKPLHPDKMKGVLHPFLRIEQNARWSPLTIFAEQNIIEEREQREDHHFMEAMDEKVANAYREWLGEKYAGLMKQLLTDYAANRADTLKQWMKLLDKEKSPLLQERYFYSFWLMMHQYSPLSYDEIEGHDGQTILKGALSQIGKRVFIVEEIPEIVQYSEKYSIQNMKIKLVDTEDAAQ